MHSVSDTSRTGTASRYWQHAAAALALSASTAGHAAVTTLTFDTDTTSNAQTLAVYGLQVDGGEGFAADGQFQLQITNVNRVTADFGSFAGNVRLDVDLVFTGLAGSMGIGFRVGDNYLLFHPGYAGGAFRIDGPGGTTNIEMGFTPTQAALNHMSIDVDAAAARATVLIVDGLDATKRFSYVFQDTNYSAGSTVFGLEVNGGSGTAHFDNLAIQTPVPEPVSAALWAFGLTAIVASRVAGARRSLRRRSRRNAAGVWALFACVCLIAPMPARASVVYLYQESVSGDLGTSTFYGGSPPILTLGPNGGLVTGTLSAGISGFGDFTTDVDAFRFVVEEGYQLVGIDVTYLASATRGGVQLPEVQNVLIFGADFSQGSVAEYFLPASSGNVALFDVTQPFQPVGHRSSPSQMVMQLSERSAPPNTSYVYDYTLRFDVQPAAASAVPEPGSLGLASAGLALLTLLRRSRRPTRC